MWAWTRAKGAAVSLTLALLCCPASLWHELSLVLATPTEAQTTSTQASLTQAHDATQRMLITRVRILELACGRLRSDLARMARVRAALGADLPVVVAPVLAMPSRAPLASARLRIGVGLSSGVADGAAVVLGERLVGRIDGVGSQTAYVRLVSAAAFRVRCHLARLTANESVDYQLLGEGIARGDGQGRLRVPLAQLPSVELGDVALTSSQSEFCPGGLVVGTVVAFAPASTLGVEEAVIEPWFEAASLNQLAVLAEPSSAGD